MAAALPEPAAERAGAPDELATTPLATLAWRAAREQHRRDRERAAQLHEALAGLADDIFRLRRLMQAAPIPVGAGHRSRQQRDLAVIADRLEQDLQACGVTIVAPAGEMYSGHWAELFESVAQLTSPTAQAPLLTEIVSPALLIHGELLRRGQAVVTIPEAPADAPS